ncbi:hypothetical protein BXZ70DRAFT_281649 [Cristinia sonorae]|uniref:RING-type domain-containing protein n=1 Tax=Cristinia sonorae TaxID=1940300 RepID=A0A8K0UYP7_9AGAR|nr:hypothetical protein BXZ70DRAFT_281649 [Cristinia sonorae]
MGNSSSSGRGHHEDTVDFGHLTPQGVYTGPRDWNQTTVAQLICERKLAPFYRPLEEYDDSWDDEQILAARKEPPESDSNQGEAGITRAESISSSNSRTHHKRPSATKEVVRQPEAAIYRGAVECPICFLYYPPNINHSRCCDQAICTECFVQIKRADPTTTHLVSEPASCPYCVQENFGVVYTPPSWRAGIGGDGSSPSFQDPPKGAHSSPTAAMKQRRRSYGADSPEVVTIDQIRPDWEAKLAAVRAAVQRRANRRIIMRQVGDRLIPVGVTSGRVHALPTGEDPQQIESTEGGADRGSRRSRRARNQNPDLNQFLGSMGLGGPDLEELMVMEAMRLSLVEHEEQQRREREAKAKEQANAENNAQSGEGANASSSVAAAGSPSSASSPETERSPSALDGPSDVTNSPTPSSDGDTRRHSRTRTHGQSLSVDLDAIEGSGNRWKRRSVSPFRVGAALRSAASTASALVSPTSSSEDASAPSPGPSNDDAASPSTAGPSGSAAATESTPKVATDIPLPSEIPNSPLATSEPVAIQQHDAAPSMQHADSFASSIGQDSIPTYDPLPSAPGSAASSFSHKPLLAPPGADESSGDAVLNSRQVQ